MYHVCDGPSGLKREDFRTGGGGGGGGILGGYKFITPLFFNCEGIPGGSGHRGGRKRMRMYMEFRLCRFIQ